MNPCTFDAVASEAWLLHPHPERPDTSRAEALGLDEDLFGRSLEGFLSTIADLLSAEPAGLHLAGDVEAVRLWVLPDGDLADQGALITVDLTNGVRLASGHQGAKDFAGREQRGTSAALSALAHIADQASVLVNRYRQTTAPGPAWSTGTGDTTEPGTGRVIVVHDRDPDASCELEVFLDGAEVDARDLVVFSIDPGARYAVDKDSGLPEHAPEVLDAARRYGPAVHTAVTQAFQTARWSAWSTS
jgi:hypothetical protein